MILYWLIPILIFFFLAAVFIRPKSLLFTFFVLVMLLEYFAIIRVGTVSWLDYIGIAIPILLIIKTFVLNMGHKYKISKDITTHIFYILIFTLFFSGLVANIKGDASYEYTLGRWAKFINGFVIFFVTSSLVSNYKDINRMCNCMMLSLIIPSILFFYQLATGDLVRMAGGMAPHLYLNNPHLITYVAAIILPFILNKPSLTTSLFQRTIWCAVIFIILVLIYFSFARTGWIAVAVECVVFIFMLRGRYFLSALALVLFSAILLSFTPAGDKMAETLNSFPVLFLNFADAFTTDNFDYLFSGRWHIIRINFMTFLHRDALTILIGSGIGGSGGHNIYFPLLLDFGLINFCLFLSLFGLLYQRAFLLMKSPNQIVSKFGRACVCITTGYLVMGLGTHIFYHMSSGVWLFWGIQGALVGLYANRKSIEATSKNNP